MNVLFFTIYCDNNKSKHLDSEEFIWIHVNPVTSLQLWEIHPVFPSTRCSYRVMMPFWMPERCDWSTLLWAHSSCVYLFKCQQPSPKLCVNRDQMLCWLLTNLCGRETRVCVLTPPALSPIRTRPVHCTTAGCWSISKLKTKSSV